MDSLYQLTLHTNAWAHAHINPSVSTMTLRSCLQKCRTETACVRTAVRRWQLHERSVQLMVDSSQHFLVSKYVTLTHMRLLWTVLNSFFVFVLLCSSERSTHSHCIHTQTRTLAFGMCAFVCSGNFVYSIKQRASCVEKKYVVVIYFVVFDHYIARAAHTTYIIQTQQRRKEE